MRRMTALLLALLVATSLCHAKPPIMTPAETPVLGEVDPFLIREIYNSKNVEASLADLQDSKEFKTLIKKHNLRLFGGPMIGCQTPSSVSIWLRTPVPSKVQVIASLQPSLESPIKSEVHTTSKENDFTAVLNLKELKPFTTYHFDVLVDGKGTMSKPLPIFKTNPERGQKVKFATAFGGGARYVPENEHMWDTVASFKPHAFLFLGDNIYIDEPKHRGKQRAMYYRRQLRPEFQRLTASAAAYAIWDDHDFGVNDSAGGLDPFKPDWKLPAWKIFKENWVNPSYGGGEKQPGCWYEFNIGDTDFLMTDGRYYRDFKKGTMLGPVQKKWLLERLKASTATFKVIASGTLWTEYADKGGGDSWWGVKKEREEIFSLIDQHKIPGVILISADRHRTDIYKIERPNGYDLYEFETSKLTNRHTHPTREKALFSYNKGNFFGMLNFDLTKPDPEMTFQCITIDGKVVHTFNLKRSQLQAK